MDKLRRHRGALRGSTTRLLSEASEILLQDTLPSSADLQERIDGLRDKDTALAELDKQIADALDGEEFDAEIVGALEYHERIVKAISRLRSAINARAPVGSTINETKKPRHAGTSDGSSNSMAAARSDTTGQNLADHSRPRAPALRVALPKLQVAVFSGENREWQGFWEHYEATIHTHPDVYRLDVAAGRDIAFVRNPDFSRLDVAVGRDIAFARLPTSLVATSQQAVTSLSPGLPTQTSVYSIALPKLHIPSVTSKPQRAAIPASTAASVSPIAQVQATQVGSHVSVDIPKVFLPREQGMDAGQSKMFAKPQCAACQPMVNPARPFSPQLKSFGHTPKDLSLYTRSTALRCEDSSGRYAVESSMAKGNPGCTVHIDYKAPVSHGLSCSLPKLSYFPYQEGECMYCPSRGTEDLQDLTQKQQRAEPYYSPYMLLKPDPGGRVSSSSFSKPKQVDDRYDEQQRCYEPHSTGYMHPMTVHGAAEYRKMAPNARELRWIYNRYTAQLQHYAMHMMQETGRNEDSREAGHNVIDKWSGDSGGDVSKYAAMARNLAPKYVSSMYAIICDAETDTGTPLPTTVHVDKSLAPSKAAKMSLRGGVAAQLNQDASGSSSSLSSEEEEESSSTSQSTSRSDAPVDQENTDYLTAEVASDYKKRRKKRKSHQHEILHRVKATRSAKQRRKDTGSQDKRLKMATNVTAKPSGHYNENEPLPPQDKPPPPQASSSLAKPSITIV